MAHHEKLFNSSNRTNHSLRSDRPTGLIMNIISHQPPAPLMVPKVIIRFLTISSQFRPAPLNHLIDLCCRNTECFCYILTGTDKFFSINFTKPQFKSQINSIIVLACSKTTINKSVDLLLRNSILSIVHHDILNNQFSCHIFFLPTFLILRS